MNAMTKFERGQIWYAQMNESVGKEEKIGRPVLIISSQEGCKKSDLVTGVYLTTVLKAQGVNVELFSPRRKSWAMCNQIYTVDKQRLTQFMCKANEHEMRAIDEAVLLALGLHTKDTEKDELKEKLVDLELELAVHKRLYEKALERLAEFKFTKDAPVIPKVKADANAEKFPAVQEVLDLTPLKKIAPKLKIEKVDRVNVNTASAREICEKTGISMSVCYSITGTRKELGPYEKLEDLLLADRFKQSHLDKYGELLEV